MKIFKNRVDILNAPLEIVNEVNYLYYLFSMTDEAIPLEDKSLTQTGLEYLSTGEGRDILVFNPELRGAFEEVFGGDIFLVEKQEDLLAIPIASMDESLMEASDVFDIFKETESYFMILLITNNTGGPTFFVPKKFANEHVWDSYRMTLESEHETKSISKT
jgi:hypothetical protein